MADTKITALAPIGAIDPANDVLPIVDVSNNSMAASGTTCRVTTNQLLQANAIASLASATISGDLTVDTSTLKVDSANNRVGIGTASPGAGYALDVNGSVAIRGASIAGLFNTDNTGVFQIYNGGATGSTNSTCVFLSGAVGVRATLDASGNFNIANGNLILGTSGKGIDFSATADGPGMTSELLNDYEEGNWTPTYVGTTGGTPTVATTYARYTKVGRLVTASFQITITNVSTATGYFAFSLPFASDSSGQCGAFRETAVLGQMGMVTLLTGSQVILSRYDNANVLVNNYTFVGTFSYIV